MTKFDPPLTAREQELWDQAFIQRSVNYGVGGAAYVADRAIKDRREVLKDRDAEALRDLSLRALDAASPARGKTAEGARENSRRTQTGGPIHPGASYVVGENRKTRTTVSLFPVFEGKDFVGSVTVSEKDISSSLSVQEEIRQAIKRATGAGLAASMKELRRNYEASAARKPAPGLDFAEARAEGMEPPERTAKRGWHTNPLWPEWLPKPRYGLPEKWEFVCAPPETGEQYLGVDAIWLLSLGPVGTRRLVIREVKS